MIVLAASLVLASSAAAQVRVSDAWARATVPGQPTAAVYLRIESQADAELVGVAAPGAKRASLHRMSMDRGVMTMRAIDKLPLPAGKVVELGPGGYHVMLEELARPLRAGETVPLDLDVRDAAGRLSRVSVRAEVRPIAAPGSAAPHRH